MFDCQVFFPAHSHVDKQCINFLFLKSYLMDFPVKVDNSNGLFVCLLSTLYRQPDIVTEYDKMNCYIAGVFPATARPFIGQFIVT